LKILLPARPKLNRGHHWAEFDLGKKVWTFPAERMKAGVEHRIPLSERAITILKKIKLLPSRSDYVFPGNRIGKPLSNMAMAAVLKRMGRGRITVNGFVSTFSDYVSEQTLFSHETREHALAHGISDKAEASYRRGDQFEKRRKLMESWAVFCEPRKVAKIVSFKRGIIPPKM
jgi:integrase